MRTKTFLMLGLVVTLLLAGGASYYASSHPDGLEYVAEKSGLLDTAEDPKTGDSPFADYATTGVENDRLSGGLAGVVGSLAVLVLAGGLAFVVRRRGRDPEKAGEPTELSRQD